MESKSVLTAQYRQLHLARNAILLLRNSRGLPMDTDGLDKLRARIEGDLDQSTDPTAEAGPVSDSSRQSAINRLEESQIPTRKLIGPYQLLRRIGQGGMGTVYLAVRADKQFEQQVAVKLLISREENREEMLWRFRTERQILANLDHPHICRLLDGGVTEEGDPYFVMEYVRGAMRLDSYCTVESLDIPARVKLFLQVCDAVQYAHQQLVIHRDLKPSNILVRDDGETKLMDFGIAKNLLAFRTTEDTGKTMAGLTPMTPEYASPEQIRGEPLGTGSDVYSLGVVLYELLTGFHPVGMNLPLHQLMHSVCEQEPARPSVAVTQSGGDKADAGRDTAKQLSGDLDWIVMMALRKEPDRRYSTVDQMAEDLRRHLDGRPVRARPQTLAYRADRFFRRHRAAVAASVLVALALAGGAATTLKQARLAERRFQDVRELADSFLFDFHDAIAPLPGATAARQLVAKKGLEYLDRLSKESSSDTSLNLQLANAYTRLGDVQASLDGANLGDTQGAMTSYQKARQLYQGLPESTKNAAVQVKFGEALLKTGDLELRSGQIAPSIDHYGQAREIALNVLTHLPTDRNANELLVRSCAARSDAFLRKSDTGSALADIQQALPLAQTLAGAQPGKRELQRLLWNCHRKLAGVYSRRGQITSAMPEVTQAENLIRTYLASTPNDADALRDLSAAAKLGGDLLMDSGRLEPARSQYQESLELTAKLAAADPNDALAQRDLGAAWSRLADLRREAGELEGAAQDAERAKVIFQSLRERDPRNKEVVRDLRIALTSIGRAHAELGKPDEAMKSFEPALALAEELTASDPQNRQWQGDLGLTLDRVARMLAANNQPARALMYFRREMPITEALLAKDPKDFEARRRHVMVLQHIGQAVRDTETAKAALPWFQQAMHQIEPVAESGAFQAQLAWIESLDFYGRTLTDAGQLGESITILRRAVQASDLFALTDPNRMSSVSARTVIATAHADLALALQHQNDTPGARQHRAAAANLFHEVLAVEPANGIARRGMKNLGAIR